MDGCRAVRTAGTERRSGFVGSEFARKTVLRGHEVVAVLRRVLPAEWITMNNATYERVTRQSAFQLIDLALQQHTVSNVVHTIPRPVMIFISATEAGC
eukprot:scaffold413_cov176-Ochromonas_danica.AAC.18